MLQDSANRSKTFSKGLAAGADISEFAQLRSDPELAKVYDQGSLATLKALETLSVPSIAMIDGAAVGGGCLVAFACDLRIITAQARMGIPAGRLGLAYPKGPIELGDAVGGARILAILEAMHAFYRDPRYRPSPWLARRARLGVALATAEG